MNDKEYRKLMRRFTVLWFLALGLAIVICAVMLNRDHEAEKQLRQYVAEEVEFVTERIDNLPAPMKGKDGRDGIDGEDGVTTIVERHTTEVITQPGKPGPQGPKGDQGEPGPKLEARVNSETGNLETRYTGDKFWQVLLPCVDLLVGCKK